MLEFLHLQTPLCFQFVPNDHQEVTWWGPTPGNSEPRSGPTGCWSGCLRRRGCRSCASWPARAKIPQQHPGPQRSWCWGARYRKLERNDKEAVCQRLKLADANAEERGKCGAKRLVFNHKVSLVSSRLIDDADLKQNHQRTLAELANLLMTSVTWWPKMILPATTLHFESIHKNGVW